MTTIPAPAYRVRTAVPLSALIVAVVAGAVNALIALGGTALGLEAPIGLQPVAFLSMTVLAAIAGAFGWHLIVRRMRRPATVLRWLVPALLGASFIPDLVVGATAGTPNGWLNAATLMTMHVATLTIGVLSYARFMPLTRRAVAS